jgi:hypothetical protein
MTYFPHPPLKRPTTSPAASLGHVRQTIIRDILWNQPVFKAPVLANPRIALDPLPFTATRITQRSPQG